MRSNVQDACCLVCGTQRDVRLLIVEIRGGEPLRIGGVNLCGEHRHPLLFKIATLIGQAVRGERAETSAPVKKPYTAPQLRPITGPAELEYWQTRVRDGGNAERAHTWHSEVVEGLQRTRDALREENEKLMTLVWRQWEGCDARTPDGQAAQDEAHKLVKRLVGDWT